MDGKSCWKADLECKDLNLRIDAIHVQVNTEDFVRSFIQSHPWHILQLSDIRTIRYLLIQISYYG